MLCVASSGGWRVEVELQKLAKSLLPFIASRVDRAVRLVDARVKPDLTFTPLYTRRATIVHLLVQPLQTLPATREPRHRRCLHDAPASSSSLLM